MSYAGAWGDPEFTERAKQRFLSGENVGQVAKDMGLTRHQLVAKMQRLGVARHVSQKKGAFTLPRGNGLNPVEQRIQSAAKNAVARVTVPPNRVPGKVMLLEDLEHGDCHWPVGDPLKPNFTFCGDRAEEKAPYCGKHMARAYAPGKLSRVREA